MRSQKSKLNGLIIFLIFILDIALILGMLSVVKLYINTSRLVNKSESSRTSINFIKTKLRSNDHFNGIKADEFKGQDAIYLYQNIEGTTYVSIIYTYDGYLRELFCERDSIQDFTLNSGDEILSLKSMEVSLDSNILDIRIITYDDEEHNISYFVRSTSYKWNTGAKSSQD